ncbi:hypothetical protein [Mycolicibacterium sp. CBMA 361]|uniref:hypothetical protein n=1 Tax=Mycolicibacterium sp. CBMA 361 TaxID=2606610 RepID=UPI001EF01FE9|nr:hypothetical protein [Mycolicibacterium sp. CBMA 361]
MDSDPSAKSTNRYPFTSMRRTELAITWRWGVRSTLTRGSTRALGRTLLPRGQRLYQTHTLTTTRALVRRWSIPFVRTSSAASGSISVQYGYTPTV